MRFSRSVEPTELPGEDVVDLASIEHHVAAIEGAAAVQRSQRSALAPVGVADLAAHVERVAVLVDDDRCDPTLAQQPTYRGRWERGAIGGLADAVVVEFAGDRGVRVDDQGDVGFERPAADGGRRR